MCVWGGVEVRSSALGEHWKRLTELRHSDCPRNIWDRRFLCGRSLPRHCRPGRVDGRETGGASNVKTSRVEIDGRPTHTNYAHPQTVAKSITHAPFRRGESKPERVLRARESRVGGQAGGWVGGWVGKSHIGAEWMWQLTETAPSASNTRARADACRIVRALEPTEVAHALATSLAPIPAKRQHRVRASE